MTPTSITVVARFVHADSGKPLAGPGIRVRFYDWDLIKNDFLGESPLSNQGLAKVTFEASAFQTGLLGRLFERLKEQKPDIFCDVIGADNTPLYRSVIKWNTNVAPQGGTTDPTIDLGVFKFRKGEGLTDADLGDDVYRSTF